MAPRSKGVWKQEWSACDRCGFMFPLSMLSRQMGLTVCPYDIDDLSNYYRPEQIQKVLSDGQEGRSDKPEVFRDPGEIVFT